MTLNVPTWALLTGSLLFMACASDADSGTTADAQGSGPIAQDGAASLDTSGPEDAGLIDPCDPPCADHEDCQEGQCIGIPCDLDCGAHGTCLGNACHCEEGYGQVLCSGCAEGYYGSSCLPCECVNGTCDEGKYGSGACTCEPDWEGLLCDEELPPGVPFHTGPYGVGVLEAAAPFTLTTLDGDWDYEAEWTGQDSVLIILKWSGSDYNTQVWNSDLVALFERTPKNTHLFFGSYDNTYHEDVVSMQGRVDSALASLSPEDAAHWKAHTHFIDQNAQALSGGIGQFIAARSLFWFAIDRRGTWREIGSLHDWPTQSYPIRSIGNEPYGFNYELQIDMEMEAMNALVVPVLDDLQHGGGWGGGANSYVEVELPSAADLAPYNRMAVHMWMRCPNHLQGVDNGCPEWDRTELVYLCDQPYGAGAAEPVEAPCQPHVAGADEQPGLCSGTEEDTCTSDADCADGATCEGYAAAISEIPADTISCTCQKPEGEIVDVNRSCRADGSGYDACPCPCNRELARWITTYGREGRWLTDLTPYLSLLSAGGTQKFRFSGNNGQPIDMQLLFYADETPERSASMQYLWGRPWGTPFNPSYNADTHPDVSFQVPEGASRVELAALITGHGNGTTSENCAEFCPFQSEFTVNGSSFTKDNPYAGTGYGCYDQIEDGVVANQFGSWPFGRAGWCPGQDVKVWRYDITDLVLEGGNTISHRGLLYGQDYTPTVTASGYMPEIVMSSWVVFYEDTE